MEQIHVSRSILAFDLFLQSGPEASGRPAPSPHPASAGQKLPPTAFMISVIGRDETEDGRESARIVRKQLEL